MDVSRLPPLERQKVMWERAMQLVSSGIDLQSHGDIVAAEESLENAVMIMESALTEIKYNSEEQEQAQRLNKKMRRYIKMIKSQQRASVAQPKAKSLRTNIIDWDALPAVMIPAVRALQESPLCGDVMTTLTQFFGFQEQNALNQKEHIVLLVTNAKLQLEPPQYGEQQIMDPAMEENNLKQAIANVHTRLFVNYTKWCKYVGQKPNFGQERLVDVALFFLLWGEAGNFRHTPEFLCYLFHKMGATARQGLGRAFDPSPPGTYLETIIRPMYNEFTKENNKKTPMGSRAEHVNIRNYDDFNEFFWTKKALKYEPTTIYQAFAPDANGKVKGAKKTFKEKRTWISAFLAYRRVFLFNCALFMACIGFSMNMTAICPQANVMHTLIYPPVFQEYSWLSHQMQVSDEERKKANANGAGKGVKLDFWTKLGQAKFNNEEVGDKSKKFCRPQMLATCLGTTQSVFKQSALIVDFPALNYVVDFGISSYDDGCVTTNNGRCGCYLKKLRRCFEVKGYYGNNSEPAIGESSENLVDQSKCKDEVKEIGAFIKNAEDVILSAGPGKLNCKTCDLAISNWGNIGNLVMEFLPFTTTKMVTNNTQRMLALAGCFAFFAILIVMEIQRCFFSRVGIGYVGRNLPVLMSSYIRYLCFWIFLYGFKVILSYQVMIKPMVEATIFVMNYPHQLATKSYHFLMPIDIFHVDYLLAMWLPAWLVFMYDVQIWYSIFSVIVGGVHGFNLRVGEVRSFRILRQTFKYIPEMFNQKIVPNIEERKVDKKGKRKKGKKRQMEDEGPLRRFERVSYSEGSKPLMAETQKYTALLERADAKHLGGGYVGMQTPDGRDDESRDSTSSTSVSAAVTGLSGAAFDRTISFAMAWNRTLETLRESDVISNRELNVLSYLIDSKEGSEDRRLYTPAFLTAGKLDEAIDIVVECASMAERLEQDKKKAKGKHVQKIASVMVERLIKDDLRMEAILGSYKFTSQVIRLLLGDEHREIAEIFLFAEEQAMNGTALRGLNLTSLHKLRTSCAELMKAILDVPQNAAISSVKFQRSLYIVIDCMENVMNGLKQVVKKQDTLVKLLNDTPLKPNSFFFPGDGQQYASTQLLAIVEDRAARDVVSRAYYLLSVDNLDAEPRSDEGRRRLRFFTNSLFMQMPLAKPVRQMRSFGVATPYYAEIVLYSLKEITQENDEGMKLVFYLATIYPFEWANFLERIGASDTNTAVKKNPEEVRIWASYRGQTLARTVRGMMYYEDAIRFLHWLEIGEDELMHIKGCACNKCVRLDEMVALKFNYVCTCQIYGKMKDEQRQQAHDIDQLLHMHPNLRVAYVDGPKKVKDGPPKFYSVLIRSVQGRIVEVFRVELPGNPIIGEGKPENHNHALVFTRGELLQVIDMNQDGYFEEALKIPNLLATVDAAPRKHPIYIVGLREHIFTGGVSNLASFMGIQELSFVSLGQRVLAMFLIRMHYGHPDIFDKLFAMTTGGTAKASKGVNLSEDIFAGFNATLRGGRVTHEEFIQVGKGRDVGMQQLTLFEAKLASGAGEAVMSRDVRRLGTRLDFWRVNTYYYGNLGWYMTQAITMLSIYAFIYGKIYMALSGKGELFLRQGGLSIAAVLNTSWAFQMGMLLVIPIIAVVGVESGFRHGFSYLLWNILTLGPIYFAFHMGTKSHYFDRTLIHGGAKYRATGRGFTIKHEKFAELYRFYAASHFYRGIELIFLLILFAIFGTFNWCNCSWTIDSNFFGNVEPTAEDWNARCYAAHFQTCVLPTNQNYGIITFSLWIIACTFTWAPFFFNPSGLDWNKCIQDLTDWQDWLKVQNETSESWLGWWMEENSFYEQSSGSARVVTLLRSSRFFILAYLMYLDMMYRYFYLGQQKSIDAKDIKVYIYMGSFFVIIGLLFGLGYCFARVAKKWTLRQRKLRKLKLYISVLVMFIGLALVIFGLSVADLIELVVIVFLVLYFFQMWFIVHGHTSHITVRAIGVFYDRIVGWLIFGPILFVAMFLPFISDFQKRIMFNPAFSAGLEVTKLLSNEETAKIKIKKDKKEKSKHH